MPTPARPPRLPRLPRRPRALALSIALALVTSVGCGGAPVRTGAIPPTPTGAGDSSGKAPQSEEDGAAIVLEPLDVGPRVITLGENPIEAKPSEPAAELDGDGLSPPKPKPPPAAGKGRGKGDDVLPQEPRDGGTELGVTTSAGAFDADAVERVVREGLPDVRRCYDRELASSDGTRATVTFTIGRSGRVTGVEIEIEIEAAGTPGAGALRTCVEEVVSSWRFPAPEAPRRVVTPLRFAPRPA